MRVGCLRSVREDVRRRVASLTLIDVAQERDMIHAPHGGGLRRGLATEAGGAQTRRYG